MQPLNVCPRGYSFQLRPQGLKLELQLNIFITKESHSFTSSWHLSALTRESLQVVSFQEAGNERETMLKAAQL